MRENKSQSDTQNIKKAAFHNLGCKVNSYELDLIRQEFAPNGFAETDFEETADVYVVNTCTVTGMAGKKSRQMLRRAKRQNPDAVVIAIGCYVETEPEAVRDGQLADILAAPSPKTIVCSSPSEVATVTLCLRPISCTAA